MSDNLKKTEPGRYEYTADSGPVLHIQQAVPSSYRGGVAFRISSHNHYGSYVFIPAEDMEAIYEAMRDAQKVSEVRAVPRKGNGMSGGEFESISGGRAFTLVDEDGDRMHFTSAGEGRWVVTTSGGGVTVTVDDVPELVRRLTTIPCSNCNGEGRVKA